MESNEAPERIYLIKNFPSSTALNTTNDNHGKFLNEWYKSREKDADIEYTRTDAFIKKACEFLFDNYHGEKLSLRMIENFRKIFERRII